MLDVKTGTRRVHEDAGGVAGARRGARRDRPGRRRADRGAHHPHGRAARPRGRQRARSDRVDRDAQGIAVPPISSSCRSCWRRGCSSSRAWPRDEAGAEARVRAAIASGAGVEKFRQIIEHQGGDPRVVDDYSRLPSAPDVEIVAAPGSGFVGRARGRDVGRAAVALGAGRGTPRRCGRPWRGHYVDRAAGDRGARRRSGHRGSAPERPRARDGAGAPAAGRADLRRAAGRAADRRRSSVTVLASTADHDDGETTSPRSKRPNRTCHNLRDRREPRDASRTSGVTRRQVVRRFGHSSARIHVRSTRSGRSSAPAARAL